MRVQMTHGIGGYRDGAPWPPVGGCIDLPDHEARDLIGAGYAVEAPTRSTRPPETTAAPPKPNRKTSPPATTARPPRPDRAP